VFGKVSTLKPHTFAPLCRAQLLVLLYGDPKGVTCEETVGRLDKFGDQHLTTGYHSQLKTPTQDNGESAQEFATTVE
jgi:hypothetical protein